MTPQIGDRVDTTDGRLVNGELRSHYFNTILQQEVFEVFVGSSRYPIAEEEFRVGRAWVHPRATVWDDCLELQ